MGMMDGTWTIEGQVFGTTDPEVKGTRINDLKLITSAIDNYKRTRQNTTGQDEMETHEGDPPGRYQNETPQDHHMKKDGDGGNRGQGNTHTYSLQKP